MDPGILDHLIAVFLVVVAPLVGMREHERLVSQSARGMPGVRLRTYRQTMIKEWGGVTILLAVWLLAGRSLVALGFGGDSGLAAWIGWALTAVIVCGLVAQAILVPRHASSRQALRQQVESLRELIPQDEREARLFAALSITAGVCEEVAYRGFLLAYATSFVGLWPAVGLSSLVFGIGHAYQGPRGILKTGGVGLVMALLFVLTGGLWAPMLVHAAIDVSSGHMARRALAGDPPAAEAPA